MCETRSSRSPTPRAGRGLDLEYNFVRTTASVRASVIERNHGTGLFAAGADVTIDVDGGTRHPARGDDQSAGRGMSLEHEEERGEPTLATVKSSLVAQNFELGISIEGSEVLLESVLVRDTYLQMSDRSLGRGINIQNGGAGQRASGDLARVRGGAQPRRGREHRRLGRRHGSDSHPRHGSQPQSDFLGGRGFNVEVHPPTGERGCGHADRIGGDREPRVRRGGQRRRRTARRDADPGHAHAWPTDDSATASGSRRRAPRRPRACSDSRVEAERAGRHRHLRQRGDAGGDRPRVQSHPARRGGVPGLRDGSSRTSAAIDAGARAPSTECQALSTNLEPPELARGTARDR